MRSGIIKHSKILIRAISRSIDLDGVEHAGYMSFMLILSLFPFLVFLFAFTNSIGISELGQYFVSKFVLSMPNEVLESISPRIKEITTAPPSELMNLAIFGTIWTSSSFVEGLRTILNRIYQVTSPPPYLFRRILSILQFLIISIIISAIIFIVIIFPTIIKFLLPLKIQTLKIQTLYQNLPILACVLFVLVSTIYYIIPNRQVDYKEVIPGSILVTFLWINSGFFISWFLKYYTQLSFIYGSLAGIIVTLLFFFIVNFIFIVGATYNHIIMNLHSEFNNSRL